MKNLVAISGLLLSFALGPGCESDREGAPPEPQPENLRAEPLGPRARTESPALFAELSPETTGIDHTCRLLLGHRLSLLNHTAFVCGGVALGDVNGDARPDIFFASGPDQNRLYLQDQNDLQTGELRFKETAGIAGVGGGDAWGVGAALVDIDGDRDLDIYVCNYDAPNQLFLNDGSGTRFTEAASRFKVNVTDASLMPAFADYDNDGDIDLFVLTYRYYRPGGRPSKPPVTIENGRPRILSEFEKYYSLRQIGPKKYTADTGGRPDRLLRNEGNGTFTDVSRTAGILERGHGLSATWWDYNRDGWLDLYVGNDFTDPDHLYRNNGDGTFSDVIAETMPYTTWSTMGADCADINGDGLLDLMCADMAATTHFKAKITMGDMGDRRWFLENAWPRQTMRNTLFLHTGTDRFMEVAFLAGVARTDWTWAVKMADFDNDGRVDIFFTNGSSRMSNDADVPIAAEMLVGRTEWDIWKDEKPLREANIAFRNHGDLRFEEVSRRWGLAKETMSYGAAYGDLDGDGDLDLVVVNLEEPASVYRNQEAENHRVVVKLVGSRSHSSATGAFVTVRAASGVQVRQANPATGFLSANDPALCFGLGETATIDLLRVDWPSGHRQEFTDLKADRRYVITEPGSDPPPPQAHERAPADKHPPAKRPWFTERARTAGLAFTHRETPFDDYQLQPLLPGKLSQLGGGLAWGDADGDGDDDLYVGGAAGQSGALFRNTGEASGTFARDEAAGRVFRVDRDHEDMAALWFDADADGDQDLLVASGGVEKRGDGAASFRDRLYINGGDGNLARASAGVFPGGESSSSAAVAGDIDRDGDLDVFIGGRVVPGRYPETPRSRLLQNDGGRFTDVTQEVAPELARAGLVTSALFSDADGDGRLDLFLTLEWGPVKLFVNRKDGWRDATARARLAGRRGWWNSITGTDADGDGDIDYAVMNVGLNTKYGAADPKKPAVLYYGDMEGNGRRRLVEAKSNEEGWVPVRGRSCSSSAMPSLRAKFPTYRSFAKSFLKDIYTEPRLEKALRVSADCFESGWLLNDGEGRFEWRPLPRWAQASPGYGVVAADFDGDGNEDLHAVENFFTREPETGLWRGGIGATVTASPAGELSIVPPVETGLVIDGDAKGAALADTNGDGWPDLAVTQNNGALLFFQNNAMGEHQPIVVQLRGPRGNPTGVGARVTLLCRGGRRRAREVYAGGGYLSQGTARLFFGVGAEEPVELQVRWPDGKRSSMKLSQAERGERVVVAYPR